jgi:hypothetical protein
LNRSHPLGFGLLKGLNNLFRIKYIFPGRGENGMAWFNLSGMNTQFTLEAKSLGPFCIGLKRLYVFEIDQKGGVQRRFDTCSTTGDGDSRAGIG